MKKFLLASISNIIMIVLPLLGKPSLIFHYKIILIIVGSICMWLTQPPVTVKETTDKKSSDKSSVILILFMSFISVVAPVIDWAYFKTEQDSFSVFTLIGICFIVIGISFRAWAVNRLGKFFTATVQIKEDHNLITSGPYTIVRHPSCRWYCIGKCNWFCNFCNCYEYCLLCKNWYRRKGIDSMFWKRLYPIQKTH